MLRLLRAEAWIAEMENESNLRVFVLGNGRDGSTWKCSPVDWRVPSEA